MRVSFRNRNLGHPLLTPQPRDYPSGKFDIELTNARRGASAVEVDISYNLESEFLSGLVDSGDAALQTLAACDGTFMREATLKTSERVQRHRFDLSRWSGTIELMPYVTAVRRIKGFASKEHDEEFAIAAPQGFLIEPETILAIGNIHEVDVDETANASSVIDINASVEVERGQFRVNLTGPRIQVLVSNSDFNRLQETIDHPIDARQATVWPGLYLHVLTEGVRNLPEHEEFEWGAAFRRALEKSHFDASDHDALQQHALEYAQRIIWTEKKSFPLGIMLDAFAEEDADPQEDDA